MAYGYEAIALVSSLSRSAQIFGVSSPECVRKYLWHVLPLVRMMIQAIPSWLFASLQLYFEIPGKDTERQCPGGSAPA